MIGGNLFPASYRQQIDPNLVRLDAFLADLARYAGHTPPGPPPAPAWYTLPGPGRRGFTRSDTEGIRRQRHLLQQLAGIPPRPRKPNAWHHHLTELDCRAVLGRRHQLERRHRHPAGLRIRRRARGPAEPPRPRPAPRRARPGRAAPAGGRVRSRDRHPAQCQHPRPGAGPPGRRRPARASSAGRLVRITRSAVQRPSPAQDAAVGGTAPATGPPSHLISPGRHRQEPRAPSRHYSVCPAGQRHSPGAPVRPDPVHRVLPDGGDLAACHRAPAPDPGEDDKHRHRRTVRFMAVSGVSSRPRFLIAQLRRPGLLLRLLKSCCHVRSITPTAWPSRSRRGSAWLSHWRHAHATDLRGCGVRLIAA